MNSTPFHHLVLDNFLGDSIKMSIPDEFPSKNDSAWTRDVPALGISNNMKACPVWKKFPPSIYQFFMQACSPHFVTVFSEAFGVQLIPDIGLLGGGMQVLDFYEKEPITYCSIHQKMNLQFRVTMIVFVTPDWQEEWGGHLGLWSGNEKAPNELVTEIAPMFGRAVLLDTTENSWHGVSREIKCPEGITLNSLVMHYLAEPKAKKPSLIIEP